MQRKIFYTILLATCVLYVLTVWQACAGIDQATAKKLLVTDLTNKDYFGISVSLSTDGKTALIGAFNDNQKGNGAGAAYIFTYSGDSWTQQAKLTADDSAAYNSFGEAVFLSADGNTALIGATGNDAWQGSAYIFIRVGSIWTQQAKLTAIDGVANDIFGNAVSLSTDGSTALIGAAGKDAWKGVAYIFTRVGSSWTQQAKLIATDGVANDFFGHALSLSADGGTALIGAYGYNSSQGAAYIFTRAGNSWTQQAKLLATDGATNDNFGGAVSLSANGGIAIIGAPSKESYKGAAYIFTGSSGTWTPQAKLTISDRVVHDSFGSYISLSADGSTALIGATGKDSGKGAGYIFIGSGNTWTQATKLTASNGAAGDYFGRSVSLSPDGNTALIGVPFDTVHSSAYAFTSTASTNHAVPWLPLLLRQR